MENRKIGKVAVVGGLLFGALLVSMGGNKRSEEIRIGTAVPGGWDSLAASLDWRSDVYVVWLFRTEDCLGCQTVDYPLRRLNAELGGSVPILAVQVGSAEDSVLANGFFHEHRVPVNTLLSVDPRSRAGSKISHGWLIPALYVVEQGRLAWAANRDSTIGAHLGLVDVVRSTLSHSGPIP